MICGFDAERNPQVMGFAQKLFSFGAVSEGKSQAGLTRSSFLGWEWKAAEVGGCRAEDL
jgi:hypothetical protein